MGDPDEGWWDAASSSPRHARTDDDLAQMGDASGLTCSITAELFRDPVLCVGDGYTYEREAVEKWFADGHTTSPTSGAELDRDGCRLIPNFNARLRADQLRGGAPEGALLRSNDIVLTSPEDDRIVGVKNGASKGEGPSLMDWVIGFGHCNGGPRPDQVRTYDWFDANGWRGSRPLHRAAMRGEVEEIRRLIKDGHDPNEMMSQWFDSEPLGWAASLGHLDAVRALILCGADPLRPANKAGNTPLTDAQRERHHHVVGFLEEYERRAKGHKFISLAEANGAPVNQQMSRDADLPADFLTAQDLSGCWGCVCCPVFAACERKRADGRDILWHQGICLPCFCPYNEAWDREGMSNQFRKKGSDDTLDYDPQNPSFVCFGLGCGWRWCP